MSGQGVVKAKPDEGYVVVGVTSYGKKSADAVRTNSASVRKLYTTLKDKGVTEENVQTLEFSLSENYKQVWEKDEDGKRVQKTVKDGFVVHNVVRVTVCELDKFGEVLDALVADGANSVSSISFGSSKSKEKLDEARKLAVADALRKAKLLTDGLGVKLGRVVTVSESGGYTPRPVYAAAARMADAAPEGNVPVSGGSLSFSVSVTVRWELGEQAAPANK